MISYLNSNSSVIKQWSHRVLLTVTGFNVSLVSRTGKSVKILELLLGFLTDQLMAAWLPMITTEYYRCNSIYSFLTSTYTWRVYPWEGARSWPRDMLHPLVDLTSVKYEYLENQVVPAVKLTYLQGSMYACLLVSALVTTIYLGFESYHVI